MSLEECIIAQIVQSKQEYKHWRALWAKLPYPHEKGFNYDLTEEYLGHMQALEAFIQKMEQTRDDRVYHPPLRTLREHRAWAIRDKSPNSPTYTNRKAYVQANRAEWMKIVDVINALLKEEE